MNNEIISDNESDEVETGESLKESNEYAHEQVKSMEKNTDVLLTAEEIEKYIVF